MEKFVLLRAKTTDNSLSTSIARMKVLCCPITEPIDVSQLQVYLNQLPAPRREKALKFRFELGQYLCAKSYLLLKQALANEYNITKDLEWTYGEHGKPFLKDYPDIHFNISHCKKGIACAVDSQPVGIDIEQIQFKDNLAAYTLNDKELYKVRNAENPAVAFTTFWTMKESYMKLTGTGLVSNLKDLLNEIVMQKVRFCTTVDSESGFVITTAQFFYDPIAMP